jgi:hypothetical protein
MKDYLAVVVLTIAAAALWTVGGEKDLYSRQLEAATQAPVPQKPRPAQPTGPQEIDFGKGNPVQLTTVRAEARAPIAFNTGQELQIRLKSGGTVVISESDLVTGDPNFGKRGLQFMALDTLELKKGARIVTGGNDFVVFANKIISEDGAIVAFTDKTRKAADFTAVGGPGAPGVSGGTVTLIAINGIEGRLRVDLSGEDGGNGATGAPGVRGQDGAKGENADWTLLNCQHDGGGGTAGANGGQGATGGPAGNGGHGGSLFLYNVSDKPVAQAFYDFVAKAGDAGEPGTGGTGGAAGLGGEGGNGGGPCHGGPRGANGNPGPQGSRGPGGKAGSQGQALVRNMDLELLIKTSKEIPLTSKRN